MNHDFVWTWYPFMCQPHKMFKHIRLQIAKELLACVWQFRGVGTQRDIMISTKSGGPVMHFCTYQTSQIFHILLKRLITSPKPKFEILQFRYPYYMNTFTSTLKFTPPENVGVKSEKLKLPNFWNATENEFLPVCTLISAGKPNWQHFPKFKNEN